MDMRGLTSFISEIRKAGSDKDKIDKRIAKELAKIGKSFSKSNKLKGYDRKKYICKLLYIYMLGYNIDFGHIEAVNLLSSNKYSEKHIGYLACTLLLNEEHEMVTLITHSMKRDLNSNDPFHQCLALTAIANIGGKEQAESLSQDVQKVLVSHNTNPDVRKKASLTLLKMYRKFPEILPPEEWSTRVLDLLTGTNLGVITSVMSLVLALVQNHPDEYSSSIRKAVRLISKLILEKNEFSKQYMYYGIRAPWLQIKLFRLLQYYNVPEDESLVTTIMEAIDRVISIAKRFLKAPLDRKSVSRVNALHSVLFEALNVAIHYDIQPNLLIEGASLLGRYVDDRDTNLRYIALDTMSRLAFSDHEAVIAEIRKKQNTILLALKDPDISIRRRALDLLYSMCNTDNAGQIVGELLDYLSMADFAIREELVLKVAILAEKYATDLEWYVDVMLTLISQSGDFAAPEVWYRIVQIITNAENETLSKYAAKTVFSAVGEKSAHERCVQVSSYLLGEFGYLIAEEGNSRPMEQFRVLLSKFQTSSVVTKCILMNTFMKFYNLYEDDSLRAKIRNLYKRLSDNLDPEIQQRAVEYQQLCQAPDRTMQVCLDQMPTFPERVGEASILIEMIKQRESVSSEKGVRRKKHHENIVNTNIKAGRVSSDGGVHLAQQQENREESAGGEVFIQYDDDLDLMLSDQPRGGTQQTTTAPSTTSGGVTSLDDLLGVTSTTSSSGTTQPPMGVYGDSSDIYIQDGGMPTHSAPPAKGGVDDLDSLFGTTTTPSNNQAQPVSSSGGGDFLDPFEDHTPSIAREAAQVVQNQGLRTVDTSNEPQLNEQSQKEAETHHKKLSIQSKGVAIEDEKLQVSIESEYHPPEGRIKLKYGNKTSTTIEKVRFDYDPISEVDLKFSQNSPLITGDAQISQYVKIACKRPFTKTIQMSLYFEHARKNYRFNIRLPIHSHKFVEPKYFNLAEEFFGEWGKIPKSEPNELQRVFKSPRPIDQKYCESIAKGHGLSVMTHIDPKPQNFVSAGVFKCSEEGEKLVLMRLECNHEKQAFRLTIRSTSGVVCRDIFERMIEYLSSEEPVINQ